MERGEGWGKEEVYYISMPSFNELCKADDGEVPRVTDPLFHEAVQNETSRVTNHPSLTSKCQPEYTHHRRDI